MTTDIPSISTFSGQGVSGPFDPAQNPSKAAAFWLRRDIVRGVFEPHERLKVEHLVQFYSVGHSPIREAILLMSESGLVVHEHQKGYRVAPVSLDDYDDVLSVYQRLYKLAIEMAIDLADDEWEERVVVQLHSASKAKVVEPDGEALGSPGIPPARTGFIAIGRLYHRQHLSPSNPYTGRIRAKNHGPFRYPQMIDS